MGMSGVLFPKWRLTSPLEGGCKFKIQIASEGNGMHAEHIAIYGSDNERRLTGLHETQSIDKFSYGVSDRGASIRIPVGTAETWKGYLEDRRPASNADPYKVSAKVIETVSKAVVSV